MDESSGSGIVLVHGYSGQPEDLEPLRQMLGEQYGKNAVCTLRLPGHADGTVPKFDTDRFGRCIDDAVDAALARHCRLILVGHSTGGNLLLEHILRKHTKPALLILVAAPFRINGNDLHRWEAHRRNDVEISLTSLAHLVSLVNRTGAMRIPSGFPVLVIQGDADPLVPPRNAEWWQQNHFGGPVNCVLIPNGGHNPFNGPGRRITCDAIRQAVAHVAAGRPPEAVEGLQMNALSAMDDDVAAFVAARPGHVHHLLHSPAARQALDCRVHYPSVADTDPVRLNIEITTRCNLACGYCARSVNRRPTKDMDTEVFNQILDLMPRTFKVTLVGLGEPTLHPGLTALVGMAADRGHRVGLVTNGMALNKSMSRELLSAGLGSLAVSLDSVDPDVAARVRPGSDVARILRNIETFGNLSGGTIPTAVFTAVSSSTACGLPDLAETVAGLNVKAWMLSDLNFPWNRSKTVWRNWNRIDPQTIGDAIRRAFLHGLPVLSVRALEALGLTVCYRDYLMLTPAGVADRSPTHTWCLSPWQTLPVDINGRATVCDCQPGVTIGNLLDTPLDSIWNGPVMKRQRRLMRTGKPPAACLGCPRF